MVTRILVRTPIPQKRKKKASTWSSASELTSAATVAVETKESDRNYKQKQKDDDSHCNAVQEQVRKNESLFCSTKGCLHENEKAANGSLCDGNLCHGVPPPPQGKPNEDKIAERNKVNSCQQNDDNDAASKKRPRLLTDDADDASKTKRNKRSQLIDLTDVPPQLPILKDYGYVYSNSCGTSKYKGVHFDKARNKWRARIRIDGKLHHLGLYDNEEEAAAHYARAALKGAAAAAAVDCARAASKYDLKGDKFIDLTDVPPQAPILKDYGYVYSSCTSKYKGVSFNKTKNKWMARIAIDGKSHHLGLYDNEEEAGIEYARAVFKYKIEDEEVQSM